MEQAQLERLRETSAALLDANQKLAQIPLLAHRADALREENVWLVGERQRLEAEIERRGEEIAALRQRLDELQGSRSWRLLAPLRRLRRVGRR